MSIKIIKNKKSFKVESDYDKKLLEVIRSLEKRSFNGKSQTWMINIAHYEEFMERLEDMNYEYKLEDNNPNQLTITQEGDKLVIVFNAYLKQFSLLRELTDDYQYDREAKKMILPLSTLQSLTEVLKSNSITYDLATDLDKKVKCNKKLNFDKIDSISKKHKSNNEYVNFIEEIDNSAQIDLY